MTYLSYKLVIVLIAGAAVAAKALSAALRRSDARKRMRAAPTELADNAVVTLTGIVRVLGEPLIAPLSGTPCVLHRSTGRVLATRRGGSDVERTHCEMIAFVLDTRDGKVIVDGNQAEVTIRPGPIIPRKLDRELAFLAAVGLEPKPRGTGFDEVVIEPGMKIAVHGVARVEVSSEATGESGFREAPTRVRLVGDDRHPLTIGPA